MDLFSQHSDSSDDGSSIAPTNPSQIQGVSIRHHVPVVLDMEDGNFGQWRHFFESTLAKFGLEDQILVTVSKGVYDVMRRDNHDAFSLWNTVEGLFHDNELQHAVYLETELCCLQQGDMSMNTYCTKLKRIAHQLHDIGHPVSKPSQVLNLLRSLNHRYRYVKPVVTSKFPPHTFQSARSFLILEELSFQHDSNAEAGQALTTAHGDHSGGSTNSDLHASSSAKYGSSAPSAPRSNNNRSGNSNGGGNGRSNNQSDRRRGRGNNNGGGSGQTQNNVNAPNT
ncbi:uncharacterized protein [Miscanthus floridulus]|uniref:uncharacterized protein n=1 Tax=Miscanthus floridulus TaxID=154761 RepID=UPI00345B1B0D